MDPGKGSWWERARDRREAFQRTSGYRRFLLVLTIVGSISLVVLIATVVIRASDGKRILPGAFVIIGLGLMTIIYNAWLLWRTHR